MLFTAGVNLLLGCLLVYQLLTYRWMSKAEKQLGWVFALGNMGCAAGIIAFNFLR